jgi:hypothetical protein
MPDRFESEPYAEIGQDLAAIETGFVLLYRRVRHEIQGDFLLRVFQMPEKLSPNRPHCRAISLSTGRPCLNVPQYKCGFCGKHFKQAKERGPQ